MTALEFIVEMQWTFLLLIILLPLIIGMIVSREFRAAILSRRLSVSTSGIEMEPTATTAALATATASDEEVAAAISEEEDEPVKPADVTAVRREAAERLVQQAAQWGFLLARTGRSLPSALTIDWEATGGPIVRSSAIERGLDAALHVAPSISQLLQQTGRSNRHRDTDSPPPSPTP